MMRESFIDVIDRALPAAGYSDRAKFIRDAVYQRLLAMGYKLPADFPTAPARKGKGGRPRKIVDFPPPASYEPSKKRGARVAEKPRKSKL